MAKVTVDASTCVGCGLCEQACPEVFKVESDGLAHVKAQCPVNAIQVS